MQRVVRACSLARRTSELILTQVALRRLNERSIRFFINDQLAPSVTDFNHPNRIERAVRGTLRTANACLIADDNQPVTLVAMNRARRAFDHADRVRAVQAGVRDHVLAVNRTVSNETRIVVVCRRAGSHAVVTARAAIEVDDHRRGAADVPAINQKVE